MKVFIQITGLILVSLLLYSNAKNTSNTFVLSKNTIDGSFHKFLKKFNADSVFQLSRVHFPLKVTWIGFEQDSLFHIEKSDFELMNFKKKKSSQRQQRSIVKNKDLAIIEIRGIDNGIHIDYIFERINNCWVFVEIIDGST